MKKQPSKVFVVFGYKPKKQKEGSGECQKTPVIPLEKRTCWEHFKARMTTVMVGPELRVLRGLGLSFSGKVLYKLGSWQNQTDPLEQWIVCVARDHLMPEFESCLAEQLPFF